MLLPLLRIFPDHVEVDVLRSGTQNHARGPGRTGLDLKSGKPTPAGHRTARRPGSDEACVRRLDAAALRREGMTMEVAARQLGVSVKTVSRWVGGATEPRLRDLRRIRELFGDFPLP